MANPKRWTIPKSEQKKYIDRFTQELPALRAKAGISQGELSAAVGISRQTYSAVEGRKRPMTWSTYLSLLFFFDYNASTREMLRTSAVFPDALITQFNNDATPAFSQHGRTPGTESSEIPELLASLDEQGLHTVKTMLLVEYARCNQLTTETATQFINGFSRLNELSQKNPRT